MSNIDSLMNQEETCLVCESSFNIDKFKMPCRCPICKECFLEWICTQNSESEFSLPGKFNCCNHKCKEKFNYEKIIDFFTTKEQERINDILLKKYFNNNPDTRRCPKQNCNYGGYIDFSPIYFNNCSGNLICDLCYNEWNEESIQKYDCSYFLNRLLRNFNGFVFDDISEIYVRLFSKPCPGCYIQIYKYTGCDHMKCPKCEMDYCYGCNQKHVNKEDNFKCQSIALIVGWIVFFFSINLLFKIVLTFNLVYLIIVYYLWFMMINIGYALYLAFLYFGLYALYNVVIKPRNRSYFMPFGSDIFCLVYSSVIFLTLSLHVYYYFSYEIIQYYSKIMFWEILIIGSLFILITIIMMLMKKR